MSAVAELTRPKTPAMNYFNEPEFQKRLTDEQKLATLRANYGQTARMAGIGLEDRVKEISSLQRLGPPIPYYIPNPDVQRQTKRNMEAAGQRDFNKLKNSLPLNIRDQFNRGPDTEAHGVEGFDHLAFIETGQMPLYNADGSITRISYRQMNDRPEIVDESGHKFSKIPNRKRSSEQEEMYYIVGRTTYKDGTSEIDQRFSKEGQAMVTTSLAAVQKHIIGIGNQNLKVIAEVQREKALAKLRNPTPAAPGQKPTTTTDDDAGYSGRGFGR